MARKVRGFERVLDAPALFAIAYGEIGASIYVALGIVAERGARADAVVLALTGLLFFVVSLSYAEGTAAIPETGGAATFTRRAFNDLVGFVTGWALFLDYLIVIALSAFFLPHYVGAALGVETLRDSPWDVVVTIAAIALIGSCGSSGGRGCTCLRSSWRCSTSPSSRSSSFSGSRSSSLPRR